MATVSVKLETRSKSMRKDGTYPVKLFVEHKGEHPAINLKIYAKPEQWSSGRKKLTCSWGANYTASNQKLKRSMQLAEQAVQEYGSKLVGWTAIELRDFIAEYIQRDQIKNAHHTEIAPEASLKLFPRMKRVEDWYVSVSSEEDRKRTDIHPRLVRTTQSFSCRQKARSVRHNLEGGKYGPIDPNIRLADLNVSWLRQLHDRMVEYGHNDTTIASHLNQLSASIMYSLLLHQEESGHELDWKTNYYFGSEKKGRFEVPKAGPRKKKAIHHSVLEAMFHVPVARESELYQWKLFAIIMFNLNGMDFVDLAHLTMRNLEFSTDANGKTTIEAVTYKRKKLKSTIRKTPIKPVYCPVNATVETILRYFIGSRDMDSEEFIFPLLKEGSYGTAQAFNRVKRLRMKMNDSLRELARLAGHENLPITTKCIRHTFGTALKRQRVNIYAIQELLGHSSVTQTEEYLANLEIHELRTAHQEVSIEVDLGIEPGHQHSTLLRKVG